MAYACREVSGVPLPEVVITLLRCSQSKSPFGVRMEKIETGTWMANWTFSTRADTARREGYGEHVIGGGLLLDANYPGCPYCGADSMFKCNTCGQASCWDTASRVVTCVWCGSPGRVSEDEFIESLRVDRDR